MEDSNETRVEVVRSGGSEWNGVQHQQPSALCTRRASRSGWWRQPQQPPQNSRRINAAQVASLQRKASHLCCADLEETQRRNSTDCNRENLWSPRSPVHHEQGDLQPGGTERQFSQCCKCPPFKISHPAVRLAGCVGFHDVHFHYLKTDKYLISLYGTHLHKSPLINV